MLATIECTCEELPENLDVPEPACSNCEQAEYVQLIEDRQCTDCNCNLDALEWGDDPDDFSLICDEDAALYADYEPLYPLS